MKWYSCCPVAFSHNKEDIYLFMFSRQLTAGGGNTNCAWEEQQKATQQHSVGAVIIVGAEISFTDDDDV